MSDRNLTTTRAQVFGDVGVGTECRICGRNVEDGRSKTCSDYCNNLLSAVMGMLNWSTVRRRVIERDDETCQRCGFDMARERLARDHIKGIIDERVGPQPDDLSLDAVHDYDDADWESYYEQKEVWRECRERMKARYGDPYERDRGLEVDHITPISEGGHPFDPANLQTLCEACHKDKTAKENRERGQTPSRRELNQSLFAYVSDDG